MHQFYYSKSLHLNGLCQRKNREKYLIFCFFYLIWLRGKFEMKFFRDYSIFFYSLLFWIISLGISGYYFFVYKSNFALIIFITLITSVIIFFFNKYVLEIRSNIRWRKLSKKVYSELNRELNGLLSTISKICFDITAITTSGEISDKQLHNIFCNKVIKEINRIVKNKKIKILESYKDLLLDGKFGEIFERRRLYLEIFEIKYDKYLPDEVIVWLIDMQKSLRLIDQNIIIRLKGINKEGIIFNSDEQHLQMIEEQLLKIVQGISFFLKQDILKYH